MGVYRFQVLSKNLSLDLQISQNLDKVLKSETLLNYLSKVHLNYTRVNISPIQVNRTGQEDIENRIFGLNITLYMSCHKENSHLRFLCFPVDRSNISSKCSDTCDFNKIHMNLHLNKSCNLDGILEVRLGLHISWVIFDYTYYY